MSEVEISGTPNGKPHYDFANDQVNKWRYHRASPNSLQDIAGYIHEFFRQSAPRYADADDLKVYAMHEWATGDALIVLRYFGTERRFTVHDYSEGKVIANGTLHAQCEKVLFSIWSEGM